MVDYYMLNKLLNKIKAILGIEKYDDTKIFTDTDDRLSDHIALKKQY